MLMSRFISAAKFYVIFAILRVLFFNQQRYPSLKGEIVDAIIFAFMLSLGDVVLMNITSILGLYRGSLYNIISILWFIYYMMELHQPLINKIRYKFPNLFL